MSDGLSALPTELLHAIAAFAHSTEDVLALAQSSRTLRATLRTPTVFEMRVRASGWDVKRWTMEEEGVRQTAAADGEDGDAAVLRHWQAASVLHDRASALLQAASGRDGFYYTANKQPFAGPGFQLWYPRWCFTDWGMPMLDCGVDQYPFADPFAWENQSARVRFIDGERAFDWATQFGRVLNELLAHDDSHNVEKLADDVYAPLWRTTFRVLLGTAFERHLLTPSRSLTETHDSARALAHTHSAFALLILSLPQSSLSSLFGPAAPHLWDAYVARLHSSTSISFTHARIFALDHVLLFSSHNLSANTTLERRRAGCALLAATLYLLLRLRRQPTDTLAAPTLPARTAPLDALLAAGPHAEHAWAGYYFYTRRPEQRARDPPMYLTLSAVPDRGIAPHPGPPNFGALEPGAAPWAPPPHAPFVLDAMPLVHFPAGAFAPFPADGGPFAPAGPGPLAPAGEPFDPTASPTTADTDSDFILFTGAGADLHGTFSLAGRCARRGGAFKAHKVYHDAGNGFEWRGFAGPWGLVGLWGTQGWGGPVWIWPQEWSAE